MKRRVNVFFQFLFILSCDTLPSEILSRVGRLYFLALCATFQVFQITKSFFKYARV
jgi:hypothetical protein